MLRKESVAVRLYLERAANASEKAAAATDPTTRRFHLAMEALKAIQTTAEREEHTFRCRNCGSEHTRRVRADDVPS